MKKGCFIILLIFLVIIGVFIYSCIVTTPTHYVITSVNCQRIVIDDSLFANEKLYKIEFSLECCSTKKSFLVGGTPYFDGCADPISECIIETKSRKQIQDLFVPLAPDSVHSCSWYLINDTLKHEIYCNYWYDVQSLKNEMNADGFVLRYGGDYGFVFKLNSNFDVPNRLILRFKDHTIECNVDNDPIYYKLKKNE